MKEILYVTAIYTGTLIGAGFATGKEIQEFFKTPLRLQEMAYQKMEI